MKQLFFSLFIVFYFCAKASITITPASNPAGYVNHPYAQQLLVSGGAKPYTWGLIGSLPTGLGFTATSSNTANIQGTPSATGSFTYSITCTDLHGTTTQNTYTTVISYQYLTVNQMWNDWIRLTPDAPTIFDTWNSLVNSPTLVNATSIAAGSGISITGGNPSFTVTNTSTVVSGTGISVTGSVSGFTVTNTGQSAPITINAGQNITVGAGNPYTIGTTVLLTSGTYTPTLTVIANCTALTGYVFMYERVGNIVTVGGTIQIAGAASVGVVDGYITVPFSSSFTGATDIAGAINEIPQQTASGVIVEDANKAAFSFNGDGTGGTAAFTLSFKYIIR